MFRARRETEKFQVVHTKPLLAGSAVHRLFNLFLDHAEVEAHARLHGWQVDCGLCQLGDFLLAEDEPPELEPPPVCGVVIPVRIGNSPVMKAARPAALRIRR